MKKSIIGITLALLFSVTAACQKKDLDHITQKMKDTSNPVVQMDTNYGTVYMELYKKEAPITVENFIMYTTEGFYDGTLFHRVISSFMVQGGGMIEGLTPKKTKPPIKNEATNKLSNKRGTIAMARTGVVDSATSQFFINVVDNAFLDHLGTSPRRFGYCVFGQVLVGMDVVDAIRNVPTTQVRGYNDVPRSDVIIKKMTLLKK